MDPLHDHGQIALELCNGGQRNVLTVGAAVENVEGFRGLTACMSPFIDIGNVLGTTSTPMAYSKVYPAMESGGRDGVEINFFLIGPKKVGEIAKTPRLTGHCVWPSFPLIGVPVAFGLGAVALLILADKIMDVDGLIRKPGRLCWFVISGITRRPMERIARHVSPMIRLAPVGLAIIMPVPGMALVLLRLMG